MSLDLSEVLDAVRNKCGEFLRSGAYFDDEEWKKARGEIRDAFCALSEAKTTMECVRANKNYQQTLVPAFLAADRSKSKITSDAEAEAIKQFAAKHVLIVFSSEESIEVKDNCVDRFATVVARVGNALLRFHHHHSEYFDDGIKLLIKKATSDYSVALDETLIVDSYSNRNALDDWDCFSEQELRKTVGEELTEGISDRALLKLAYGAISYQCEGEMYELEWAKDFIEADYDAVQEEEEEGESEEGDGDDEGAEEEADDSWIVPAEPLKRQAATELKDDDPPKKKRRVEVQSIK